MSGPTMPALSARTGEASVGPSPWRRSFDLRPARCALVVACALMSLGQGQVLAEVHKQSPAPDHQRQVPVNPGGADAARPAAGPPVAAPVAPEEDRPISAAEAARLAVRCHVPEDLTFTEASLPRLALRLKAGAAARAQSPVPVVVLGTGSSAGAGVSAPDQAYPARLQRELERVFPGRRFEVRTLARRGARVADMLARLEVDVVPRKPALLVWQIGVSDAVEGVPVNRFGSELQRGLARLEKADIDVMLMDMQFSPFTGLLINAREYRGYTRWIAKRAQVPLLRRYDMMEFWDEQGVFDLGVTHPATADGIHACIAHQAAGLIEAAVLAAGR